MSEDNTFYMDDVTVIDLSTGRNVMPAIEGNVKIDCKPKHKFEERDPSKDLVQFGNGTLTVDIDAEVPEGCHIAQWVYCRKCGKKMGYLYCADGYEATACISGICGNCQEEVSDV